MYISRLIAKSTDLNLPKQPTNWNSNKLLASISYKIEIQAPLWTACGATEEYGKSKFDKTIYKLN
jgi:hypothetical protein